MRRFTVKKGIMFVTFVIVAIIIFSGVVMTLWNNILPAVLGVKAITFFQALGILVLSRLLFGGFGTRRWGNSQKWKNLKDKWATMNDEEREEFKMEFRDRCRSERRREV